MGITERYRSAILSEYSNTTTASEEFNNQLRYAPYQNRAMLADEYAENLSVMCRRGKIVVYPHDRFPDHVEGLSERKAIFYRHYGDIYAKYPEKRKAERAAWAQGAYRAEMDFDHITPDWSRLLSYGWSGLAELWKSIPVSGNPDMETFCRDTADACASVCHLYKRFADAYKALLDTLTDPEERATAQLTMETCQRLSEGAPSTLQDALALIFFAHQLIDSELQSVCTLGRLDDMLGRFVDADIAAGRLTREDAVDLFASFFVKYTAAITKNPKTISSYLGKSCYIGGLHADGSDVTNETTFIVIDAIKLADVLTPKLAIRLSDRTPERLYDRIAQMIRDDGGHAVLCGDKPAVEGLKRLGIAEGDAYNYTPIGCYEPTVVGREVGCSGATSLSLVKPIELAMNCGIDPLTGCQLGEKTASDFQDFDAFFDAVLVQCSTLINQICDTITTYEKHYPEVSPTLLLSATMEDCLKNRRSAYDGGLPYNNTACNCGGVGSAADILHAIRTIVYEEHIMTLPELREILAKDWEGAEHLRRRMLSSKNKWGCGIEQVDVLGRKIAEFASSRLLGRANGRGGSFKPGLYSIDRAYYFGHATGATADGRKARDAISKNLCSQSGMDFAGITAEIGSVLKLDFSMYPNGSVLDLMLHPSAVSGDDGLHVLKSLIKTYIRAGGYGIQFNVYDVETLRAAQQEPEKYQNLQIRLCGWNAYFVSLTKEQQDHFIAECESSTI